MKSLFMHDNECTRYIIMYSTLRDYTGMCNEIHKMVVLLTSYPSFSIANINYETTHTINGHITICIPSL